MVELHHADDKRNVTLYASRDESEWRQKWEAAARRLGLKALEDSEDGLLERAPEDLDKSVAELIEEGKVAVDYAVLQHKAAGIAVDMDGDTVVVTRQRPQNTLVGALIFLAFPLVFIWVGFYSDAPVPINWLFGGLGLLFETLILLGVAWDLLSRRRLRVGPQRVRVCSVSRWGETKGKSLAVADIETVKLGREDGRSASPGLMLAGDRGKLSFGRRLPDDTLEFLRNLVLAKIEKHHVPA